MAGFEYRLDMYEFLNANRDNILAEVGKVSADIGVPDDMKGRIGMSGANSSYPGVLRREILDAIEDASTNMRPVQYYGDQIRRVVKSVYGDDYDAVPTSTCEGALLATYESLVSPPTLGRGEAYRVRMISPFERHIEHHLSYGRPFPPRYKDIFADRGATAGELGITGRRLENVDIVIVPLEGARYDVHGIKAYACPLLLDVDAEASAKKLRRAAEVHSEFLGAVVSLAYDTPGYGYEVKNADGVPALQRSLADIAADFGVPYVADNAIGIPFIGADPRKTGADVMVYSMDKVAWAPTSGLAIGREDSIVQIRRAMGVHSQRYGTTAVHGKGMAVALDPGREAMSGQLAALRILRDEPERVTRPVDETYEIIVDEYQRVKNALGEGIQINKSFNFGGVEMNYQNTWGEGVLGIPIFSQEDRLAGTNLIDLVMAKAGIVPSGADDANMFINPGLGTVDASGALIEERMRLVVRGVFSALALLAEWADKGPNKH